MIGKRGHGRDPVRVCVRRGRNAEGKGKPRVPNIGNRRGAVIRLLPEEPARFNPDMLEALCRRIGETRAEAEVARALERISTTVAALDTLATDADAALLAAALRSLIRDADIIGMVTLARVSRSVLCCLGSGDRLAYCATLARLERVGRRSIHAVWDLEDLSG